MCLEPFRCHPWSRHIQLAGTIKTADSRDIFVLEMCIAVVGRYGAACVGIDGCMLHGRLETVISVLRAQLLKSFG